MLLWILSSFSMLFKVCKLKFYIWSFLFLISQVKSDLPIHTLTKDVIGVWKVYETELSDVFQNCGSTYPNKNSENLKIDNFKEYLEEIYGELSESVLELSDERYFRRSLLYPRNNWSYFSAKSPQNNQILGNWTMVYDEGVMIDMNDKNYFGYFKYNNVKNNECKQITQNIVEDEFGHIKCYVTDPNRLQIGWYSKKNNNDYKFGCFYMQKLSYKDNNKKNYIVDLTYYNSSGKYHPHNLLDGLSNWSTDKSEITNFSSLTEAKTALLHQKSELPHDKTQLAHDKRKLGYENLAPFRFVQLCKGVNYHVINNNFNMVHPCTNKLFQDKKFPTQWTWGDPFNGLEEDIYNTSQGDCGSCYIYSSLYVISKRLQILFNKLYPNHHWKLNHFKLSIHDLLSSVYSQGCFGGFLMLVGKHIKELGIHSTDSESFLHTLSIPLETDDKFDIKWYIDNYGYVGGCYECTNEVNMMNEIITHGPIAVAIYSPPQLFYYQHGIFDNNYKHGMICDLPHNNLNGWEYTNHAIVIVGWGEELLNGENVKYWICKNTWGTNWGVQGYFKIKKGVNLCGIESQAVFFDPSLNKGLSNKYIQLYNLQFDNK